MEPLRRYVRALTTFSPNARRYLAMTALLGVGTSFQWLFFNLYVLSLGFDQAFVGLLAGIPALVTAISALPIGLLLPRIGYRRGLLAGSFLYVSAFVSWALFPMAPVLIAGGVLAGLGSSLLFITSSPLMVAVSTERNRTQLFGVQFGLNTLVGVLANLVGGYLPRVFAGAFGFAVESPIAYRAVLLVAMALAISAIIPIARLRGLAGNRHDRVVGFGLIAGHWRTFVKLLAVQLTVALGAGMLMPFVNVFYKLRFDLPDPSLGVIFSISSLLTGLSAFAAPLIADRIGKVRTIVVTQALSLPFLVAMGFAPWFGASAAGFLIRTALMNMSAPVFMAFTMGLVPGELRPLTSSLLTLAWNAGWAISSAFSGWIQVSIGFWPLFIITGSIYAGVVLLTYLLFRNARELSGPEIIEKLHVDEEERV